MVEMNQADFARLIGMDKAHVTRMKQADRLVMTPGGLIDVDASLEKMAATSGNSPQARAQQERWRELRNDRNPPATQQTTDHETIGLSGLAGSDIGARIGMNTKAQALRKLKADADRAEMERDILLGKLVDRDEVLFDITHAVNTINTSFDGLPDRCTPLLVNQSDMATIRAVLRDDVEYCLSTAAAELNAIVKGTRS